MKITHFKDITTLNFFYKSTLNANSLFNLLANLVPEYPIWKYMADVDLAEKSEILHLIVEPSESLGGLTVD